MSNCDIFGIILLALHACATLYSIYIYILVNSHFSNKSDSGFLIWNWFFNDELLDELGKKYRKKFIFVVLFIFIIAMIFMYGKNLLCV